MAWRLLGSMLISIFFLLQDAEAVRLLPGGKIADAQHKPHETGLAISTLLRAYPEGFFVAGHEILPGGKNQPAVVMLDRHLEPVARWIFPEPVKDIFRFREQLYLLDLGGHIYHLQQAQWQADSRWTSGENPESFLLADDVILCHPAPLTKAESGTRAGGCQSLAHGWNVPLYWTQPKPKLCGQELRVLAWANGRRILQTLNPADGSMLRSRLLPRRKDFAYQQLDLCQPFR